MKGNPSIGVRIRFLGQRARRSLVCLAVAATLFHAAPAMADSSAAEFARGGTAAICSLFYGPAKIIYALGGSLVGGVAWVFSGGDSAVSQPIWDASLRGDYVVTVDDLAGTQGPRVRGPLARAPDGAGGQRGRGPAAAGRSRVLVPGASAGAP